MALNGLHLEDCPKLLIIGAGARGNAYARATFESTNGVIVAVADPIPYRREALARKYIWPVQGKREGQEFESWEHFLDYESTRRRKAGDGEKVSPGVDGAFVCTLDETHADIITGLSPLGLHLMSEKPLATTLEDCLKIYRSLMSGETESTGSIFSIGHVLHYSPHNMLLRDLLLNEGVIGNIISMEHTEPVGWWHFSHSYVRGNWRKESSTAPSLLTKSCHDIDFLLWILCSQPGKSGQSPHLPSYVTSMGSLVYFKKSRKPTLAGEATNCLSCPAEKECIYSAKKIYDEAHLAKGNADWPVHIVDAEIEDCLRVNGMASAKDKLMKRLGEDYDNSTPQVEIDRRPWFGRCVYECDNDVCDDQVVTISWEDDFQEFEGHKVLSLGKGAKTASFHMVAFTEKQCERRGRVYGTKGEIEYDSKTIRVYDFATSQSKVYHPHQPGGGHGGGDDGLTQQFVKAIEAVKKQELSVGEAQMTHIGCTIKEIMRSHAMVFAAEEARKEHKMVDFRSWWDNHIENMLSSVKNTTK